MWKTGVKIFTPSGLLQAEVRTIMIMVRKCLMHLKCAGHVSKDFTCHKTLSHPAIFKEGAVINPHLTDENTESQELTQGLLEPKFQPTCA